MWSICKETERDRWNVKFCVKLADDEAKRNSERGFSFDSDGERKVIAHTPKGNPITDTSYQMFTERVEQSPATTVQSLRSGGKSV